MKTTESAKKKIITLLLDEEDINFRVEISSGGCSGFSYGFFADKEHSVINSDDHVFDIYGKKMIIDPTSLSFIANAELDYVSELVGSGFRVNNPDISASCGCGNSFGV